MGSGGSGKWREWETVSRSGKWREWEVERVGDIEQEWDLSSNIDCHI